MTWSEQRRQTTSSVASERIRQQQWARLRGIPLDAQGYTLNLENNLLQPLSAASRVDFTKGDGAELGVRGRRGKIQALHSSSALACNVFDYWRSNDKDRSPLADALEVQAPVVDVSFEQKFRTGIGPRSPNIDVVLHLENGGVAAIESKFLECYSPRTPRLADKYLCQNGPGLWERKGLNSCERLARSIGAGQAAFTWLHVEQLLKHVLGLADAALPTWELIYLWYQVPGAAVLEHEGEIETFALVLESDGVGFRTVTYQQLFSRLRNRAGGQHGTYVAYLEDRYFATRSTVD